MPVIKKALAGDFESIYPLLRELNDTTLTKEDWRQLFVNHCGGEENYFGYALFEGGRAIGFLGLIFSHRLVGGSMRKFCNMTSWIITKEFQRRGLGRMLLLETIKLNDHTIVDLTATKDTVKMLKENGFKELEDSAELVLPVPSINILHDGCSAELAGSVIKKYLSGDDLKIYNDHLKFNCIHFMIRSVDGNCYVVATETKRKGLPFAHVHYIGDIDVFSKHIRHVIMRLCVSLRVLGFFIDERFLKGKKIRYAIRRRLPPSKFFRSDSLDREHIADNLYTELIVLNLGL